MKKIFLLYATREGQTEKIATRIAAQLRLAGASVELCNAADTARADAIDPADFDLLVFGASMHAGGLEQELVRYVNRHKRQIEQHARSFFLVLLSAATEDPALRRQWLNDASAKMQQQLQVRFEDTQMIAGALTYSKYSLPLKWLMQRIAKQAGGGTDTSRDYEYTDWQQVEAYAKRLAER